MRTLCIAIVAGCATASQRLSVVDIGIEAGQTIFLRASTGSTVTVQDAGLHTKWNHHGLWQSLKLEKDGSDSAIFSGDTVYVKTAYGKYLTSANGTVFARAGDRIQEQAMTIEKEGGGFIQSGDTISLVTRTGHRIAAESLMVHARLGDAGESVKFVIEADEPGEFDGRWTEESDPGREVFVIKRDAMHLVSRIETQVTPLGNHKFTTGLSGKTAHRVGSLWDDEIYWNNGDVWVRTQGQFDGRWTDSEHAGGQEYSIKGSTLTLSSGEALTIRHVEGAMFYVDGDGAPSRSAELIGFEIHWSSGAVWQPVQAGEFDGRWTSKQNPEADYFDIEGRCLFFDAGLESKITPKGHHQFSTELVGERQHSNATLKDDELHWSNGDVWLRAKVIDPNFWKFTFTATTSTATTITFTTRPRRGWWRMRTTTAPTTTSEGNTTTTTTEPASTTLATAKYPCWEENTYYEPFDMDKTLLTIEYSIEDCQRRCRNTPHCTHFSYWNAVLPGHCHLQDVFAIKVTWPTKIMFQAGPPDCYINVDHRKHGMVKLNGSDFGNNTFVPWAYRCLEMGRAYSPSREVHNLAQTFKKGKKAVKECMRLCRTEPWCAHFTIGFPHKHCALSDDTAQLLWPIFKHIAGPPSCEGHDEDPVNDVIIEAFLSGTLGGSLRSGPLQGRSGGASLGLAAVASAAGLGLLALAKVARWGFLGRDMRISEYRFMENSAPADLAPSNWAAPSVTRALAVTSSVRTPRVAAP